MEALPATHEDNSGANPSSVKSDDSTPPHESGRGSPPPNCAICLGTCRNKSFTDSCLHQFCFKCLLTWSKVKAECPLCKQNFRSIIHNVRSNHQYEEYMVEQRHTEETVERIDIDNLTTATRRFRYRTTLTLPRSDSLAIQQLLVAYPRIAEALPPPPRLPPARRRRSPTSFRRTVYRHNLWARPLPDFTGRFRDCTPEFYRYNDSQMHRLVPWLNRELHYLLNENVGHISYVMSRILELLPQYHITSPEFREAMQRYFGERTEHFLHELYCFASTPYDMTGYDRNVQYTTDSRISTMVNEVISSSDSEASVDSDIVMVSSSEPAEAPPGPSRVPAPAYPHHYIPPPAPPHQHHPAPVNNVIPIETISHSDTDDDDSEVMVVGYIKPPQDRTPEVVDLLGSDSDVIVQETIPAEPTQGTSSERAGTGAFNALDYVKLSLKRHRQRSNNSDSDESYRPSPSPPPRRRRRQRSNYTATTSDTCRTTPSPGPVASSTPTPTPSPSPSPPPAPTLHSPSYTPPTSPRPTLSAAPPNNGSIVSDNSATTSNSSRRKKTIRKKSKRKDRRDSNPDRTKKKSKKRSRSRSRHREKRNTASGDSERDRRSKQKSLCGKGVKSSKKSATESVPTPQHDGGVSEPAPAAAGPSGASSRHRSERDRERSRRRASRENRRLRSVVNVMYSNSKSSDSSPSRNSSAAYSYDSPCSSTYTTPNCGSVASDDSGRTVSYETAQSVEGVGCAALPAGRQVATDDFDSEDNLPLNLTVKKTYPFSEM